jgi:hypothetical protein
MAGDVVLSFANVLAQTPQVATAIPSIKREVFEIMSLPSVGPSEWQRKEE